MAIFLQLPAVTGPFLLTGASGWFGRTALYEYEQEHGPEALRRDVIPFASRERWVDFDSPHGPVKALPLEAITQVSNPRGLLQLAFLTRDKVEELGWERYVTTNRAITAKLGEVLRAWPMMPVVAISSGAAAALDGKPPDLEGNPYATLKQEEEALLESESATRMAMVFRVYAASGRFMTRPEKFALGDFLLQALQGEVIRVRAPHRVTRSYVSIESLMALSWELLRQPSDQQRFRLMDACTNTLDLRELAGLVAAETSTSVQGPTVDSHGAPDLYQGETGPFRELLRSRHSQPLAMEAQIHLTHFGLKIRHQLDAL